MRFLLLLLLPSLAAAQTTARHPWPLAENRKGEKLFFVPEPTDSFHYTGSVKTATGKVILPGGFWFLAGYRDTIPRAEEVFGNFVVIVPQDFKEPVTDTAMHYSYSYATFNQQGQFLNHPFPFDNGPDYWREGRRRVVEDGKMGLTDRLGNFVIPAETYRFLYLAGHGLVHACRDCSFYNPQQEEHGGVFKGEDWDALDVDGNLLARHVSSEERVNGAKKSWQQKATFQRTTPLTRRLAVQLLCLPQTAAHARMYDTPLRELQYVCYDVPSTQCPYYHFGLEGKQESSFPADDMQVLISPDGKKVFHLEEDLQRLVPLKNWKMVKTE